MPAPHDLPRRHHGTRGNVRARPWRELVSKRWVTSKKPRGTGRGSHRRGGGSGCTNDAHTTEKLHPPDQDHALDRIWTVQKKNGGFQLAQAQPSAPPMESDEHYGVTLAALAVGVAPEAYAKTELAQKGVAGLQSLAPSQSGQEFAP